MKIDNLLIENIAKEFSNSIHEILNNNEYVIRHEPKEIDCSLLDDKYFDEDITFSENFKHIFEELNNKIPTLYIYEIISDIKSEVVKARFLEYRNNPTTKRPTPATYKHKNSDSRILYVGKVNTENKGRTVVHLGIGPEKFHGLQLMHWAKEIKLKLNLHIFEFKSDINDKILNAIESQAAIILKPLIGKHQ
jgi:hypothetical protein